MNFKNFDRREFIKTTAIAGAALLPFQAFGFEKLIRKRGHEKLNNTPSTNFVPEVDIRINCSPQMVQIFSGNKTSVWKFSGEILKGAVSTLTQLSNSYVGPTIRVKQGQNVRVRFNNLLPEKSIIHWHGLHLPEREDSHPSYAIEPQNEFVYEFKVENRAGTYWYHPHPHGRTAYQIYHGLCGLLIVEDAEEESLGLPSGDFEKQFVVQDRLFDTDNSLNYSPMMMGMFGDRMFLNGMPREQTAVAKCPHRIRILNASNARFYKLAWSDGSPLEIIGTDGGLLERPINRNYLYLAPGERIDLWKDFSSYYLDTEIKLVSLAFQEGRDKPFDVIPFKVENLPTRSNSLPSYLSKVELLNPIQANNYGAPKRFTFSIERGQGWTIDSLSYEMRKSRPKETIKLGSMEIWEFTSEGMMAMPHPVHVHGSQFQVISRTGSPDEGFLDTGWKDTVLISAGEVVQIIKRFDDFTGYFPFHCHNLEHGAMGMMRDFHVVN